MNISGDIANLLKLPVKIMIAIALASGLILFLPDYIIQKMYMVPFRNKYGFTIGIVFCISLSITVVSFIALIYDYCVNKYYKKMFIKKSPERLRKLSSYQQAILFGLFMEDNHTEHLPYNDGAVRILEHSGYILRTSEMTLASDLDSIEFPYTLQPWVIDELSQNKELQNEFRLAFNQF
ncbi:superinfection exclusion B family protein [Lacrimispora sp.]|jgi:hypothetical protein|uniref:superinfection exclusion B family protein n=1 Tax=Lacrimispora sp. TaxID=2719234 RepID=UPI00289CE85F|nr:superinfection exclusion B family protein [Lacrimispora sp.]